MQGSMNESKIVVTCIMFTYNHFERVFESLDSVFMQDYPFIELGIFDDCSTEFPREEIETYILEHKRNNIVDVKIVQNEKNLGTVKNINKAEKMFNGKYIINISPEDPFIDCDVMSQIVSEMEKRQSDVITTYKVVIDEKGDIVSRSPSERVFNNFINKKPKDQFKAIAMGSGIAGPGTYYKREYLERIGFFDENYKLQEDGPMLLKTTRNGTHIDGLPIVSCYYRLGSGVSSSAQINPILINDVRRMFDEEVIPYLKEFTWFERRRIDYQIERLSVCSRVLSLKMKIKMGLKYPDVLFYRMLYAR